MLGCHWGAVCRAPVSSIHRRRGTTSCRLLRGAPHVPRVQAATEKKHAERITALQAAVQSKGRAAEKAADLVATCSFTLSRRGVLSCCASFAHSSSTRVAHLMTCSCRSCSVIDLQEDWCG